MTPTRYFEVKVTGCMNCPSYEWGTYNDTICSEWCGESDSESWHLIRDNKDQLTDSCPMAAQHKESETK